MIRRSFTWAIAAVATTATLGCLAFLRVAHGNAGSAVERKLSLLRTLGADEVLTGSDLATLESWLGREQSRVYERGS